MISYYVFNTKLNTYEFCAQIKEPLRKVFRASGQVYAAYYKEKPVWEVRIGGFQPFCVHEMKLSGKEAL